MLKTLQKAKASAGNTLLILFCSIATAPAFAGGSFGGVNSTEFLTDAKGTAGQGFNFAGLVVAALGFLGVAYYAIAVFSESAERQENLDRFRCGSTGRCNHARCRFLDARKNGRH